MGNRYLQHRQRHRRVHPNRGDGDDRRAALARSRMEGQVDGCELQFFPFGRPFSEGYIAVRVGLARTTQPCESGSGASATRTVRRSDGIEITISASKTTLPIPVPAALVELLVVLTDVPLPRVQASVVPWDGACGGDA